LSVGVDVTLKFLVEKAETDPIKIREFIRELGTQEIKLLLKVCQQNAGKDLPKRNYGLVHQDLINFLGEKLGFDVEFGDYKKGPDGIWKFKGTKLIIESKASPTWLEIKQASDYVKKEKAASGLIICPEFTEDNIKAAQGYGNVRLLTTDGLCKLTELKDKNIISTEDVMSILLPQETVKLDFLVNILYRITAAPPSAEGLEKGPEPIDKNAVVAVYPSRPDGVKFLLKNNAWGYVRKPSKKIDYIALYVTKPQQSIVYYGKVRRIIPQEEHPTLARQDRKGKCIIELERVEKLKEPIALGEGDVIQGMRYTSLGKLLTAKTTKDLW